jgi:hypothetical protein
MSRIHGWPFIRLGLHVIRLKRCIISILVYLGARELNVSRQAVIKTLVRQALDQHYLAQRARQSPTR